MMLSAYLLRRLRIRMAARAAYEAARDAEIEPDDLDISVDLLRELVEQATRIDPRSKGRVR